MKQVILTLSIIIIFSLSSPINSQEKSPTVEKKVMIIKSSDIEPEKGENIWISKDGKEIDVESDDMIFIGDDVSESEKDISVNINKEIRDGDEVRIFEISIQENGKKKLIKWEDNGEIPEDVGSMLEAEGIDINMFTADVVTVTVDATAEDTSNKEKESIKVNIEIEEDNGILERAVEVTIDGNGEIQVMKWEDNGKTPSDIQEKLDELGIDLEEFSHGEYKGENKDNQIEKRIYKIDLSDGGEVPTEIREELDQYGLDLDVIIEEAIEHKEGTEGTGKKVRIIKFESDGDSDTDVEIFQLQEGEDIPDDVKQKLKDEGIDIQSLKNGQFKKGSEKSQRHVIKIKDENGDMKVIKWDGKGEMPAEMKKQMEKMEKEGHSFHLRSKPSSPMNKAQLGVVIEEHDTGILVSDVIAESAAEKVGIMAGDVITHIDGLHVLDISSLLGSLSDKMPGDDAEITYVRDNAVNKAIAHLTSPIKDQSEVQSFDYSDDMVIKVIENCNTDKLSNDEDVDLFFKSIVDKEKVDGLENLIILRTIDIANEKSGNKNNLVQAAAATIELPKIDNNKKLKLDDFKAFPNPTSGFINISFEGKSSPIVVQLSDMTGRTIFKETLNNFTGSFNRDIDLSEAQKGQFILYVIQDQKVFTESLIVQ